MKNTALLRSLLCASILFLATGLAGAADRYEELYIPNGLATADVGDWVTIKLPNGTKQKHSITKRTGEGENAKLTLRIETLVNDKVTSAKEETHTAGEQFIKPPSPKDKKRLYERREEDVAFEDSEIQATIIDVYEDDKLVRTWYLSTEFPIYATYKRVNARGTVEFEVVDYDFGVSTTEE